MVPPICDDDSLGEKKKPTPEIKDPDEEKKVTGLSKKKGLIANRGLIGCGKSDRADKKRRWHSRDVGVGVAVDPGSETLERTVNLPLAGI